MKSLYCIRNAQNNRQIITSIGREQINSLRFGWTTKNNIELVVTDNTKKSMKTAEMIFDGKPIIPLNLQSITSNSDKKLNMFYHFLKNREECMIAYVGHGKFINYIKCTDLYYNSSVDIKRVHPYLVELTFQKDLCDN